MKKKQLRVYEVWMILGRTGATRRAWLVDDNGDVKLPKRYLLKRLGRVTASSAVDACQAMSLK